MKAYENKWKFITRPIMKVLGCNQVAKSSIRQHAKKEIEKELEIIESDLIKYDWAELDSMEISDTCKHCPSVHNAFCYCTLRTNIIY